jgi:hypothetical protein
LLTVDFANLYFHTASKARLATLIWLYIVIHADNIVMLSD